MKFLSIDDDGLSKIVDLTVDEVRSGLRCRACGNRAGEFRDQRSIDEFTVSSLCQGCQDKVFIDTDNR